MDGRNTAIVVIALAALLVFFCIVVVIQENKLCSVSVSGDFAGKISLNQEYNESLVVFDDFLINKIDGSVTVTVPCKALVEHLGGG